jgi:hypothetical protein
MLEIGDRHTRSGLCEHYLANFDGYALVEKSSGAVRAVAVMTSLNPNAPSIILPGFGEKRQNWTEAIEHHAGSIEVWVMDDLQKSKEYEFKGWFAVVRVSRAPEDLAAHVRIGKNNTAIPIEAVVWLQKTEQTPKR